MNLKADKWRKPKKSKNTGVCCVKSYVGNELTFTNRKRTDLLVNVGTFPNVTFYTTDPSTAPFEIMSPDTVMYLMAGRRFKKFALA